jgi:hypothetical protein
MNNDDEQTFVVKSPIVAVVSKETQELQKEFEKMASEICPMCGGDVYKSGRCSTCYSCGWSTCSI